MWEESKQMNIEQSIGQKMLVHFEGYELPSEFVEVLRRRYVGGVSLFRPYNVQNPAQVRELTASMQQAAMDTGQPPLLIAADQEGGTLQALAGTTQFPGNMALGATRSPELARRSGLAIGRELAAMGVNVNYAPVCDVNSNPRNPAIGTRSFGEDPSVVAQLAGAMVEGLQQAGIAATAKHFPGHGDTEVDSHLSLPVVRHAADHVKRVELPPFVAAIKAGAKMIMTAHIALPELNDGLEMPATLSRAILQGLLRGELGFEGVIVSDAMNMRAIQQGPGLVVDTIAAVVAGNDLLLFMESVEGQETLYSALVQAAGRGLLSADEIRASVDRILGLKSWLSKQEQPGLDVVRCAEHQAVAYEIASKALTLVRDQKGYLPLNLPSNARVLAVVPRPADLTPADTSSYDTPLLAEALRRYHSNVEEVIVPMEPSASDVDALKQKAVGCDLVVIGTISAAQHRGQAELVRSLVDAGIKVIAVAMRLPNDITAYPEAPTYICTYSIQPASVEALADALWGRIAFSGTLPMTVPGL
jgi:beta-N-acetylhexosaminidase